MESNLNILKQRQSCRSFDDRVIEHEKLVQCVEAGRLTPSACNSQPWKFVVVETPAKGEEVAKCGQQIGMNAFLSQAKAFIIITEEHAQLMPSVGKLIDSQYFAKGDLGAATLQVCLAAEGLGIGSCIIGIYDRNSLAKILDLSQNQQFAAFIALGYPKTKTIRTKQRKSLEEVARFI
jgi:nitroreductase